jgi:hypothetical protein
MHLPGETQELSCSVLCKLIPRLYRLSNFAVRPALSCHCRGRAGRSTFWPRFRRARAACQAPQYPSGQSTALPRNQLSALAASTARSRRHFSDMLAYAHIELVALSILKQDAPHCVSRRSIDERLPILLSLAGLLRLVSVCFFNDRLSAPTRVGQERPNGRLGWRCAARGAQVLTADPTPGPAPYCYVGCAG